MKLGRPSLIQLMTLVIVLAVGLAAMKIAAAWLARGVILGSTLALLVVTLGSIVRTQTRHRPTWVGTALFGWGYLLIATGGPYLADQYNNEDHFDIWELDGAIRIVTDRIHPPLAEPVDPFPENRIDTDPATGVRLKVLGSQKIPLEPAEVVAQVQYELQTKASGVRLRAGRHARVIGLAIQGVAFALIGGIAGQALSDRTSLSPLADPIPGPG